ncbi:hypothetical protein [Thermodesulfobacterium hydrogeniphilum]|uniref:hypothetical protein n=1 Tax=Thermodesulfobacterium hydrogeniphilum TaxID=161156 RepID=UPI00056E3EA6|nr:hypothetical protein [Thermodesulfobacterium hydrogeniphilum]
MKNIFPLVILLILSLVYFNKNVFAQHVPDIYEFYDIRTEITLRGKVKSIWITKNNIVLIGVKRKKHIYTVILGPQRFLKKRNIKIDLNDRVIIKGSKYISREGNLYIIARFIKNFSKKQIYYLRDKNMRPYWRVRKRKYRKHFFFF